MLDQARLVGVTAAARSAGIEPNIIYTWKPNEAAIRRAARAEEKKTRLEKTAADKLKAKNAEKDRQLSLLRGESEESEASGANAASYTAEGPEFRVHGLGAWLDETLRKQLIAVLPAAVGPRLKTVLDEKLAEIEQRLTERVRSEIRAVLLRGAGESDEPASRRVERESAGGERL